MKEKRAIVLGGTVPHIELIRQLKERGYHTILVDYLPSPPAKRFADLHIQESTLDHDKVYELACRYGVDLVIATCIDHANGTACDVMERLGKRPPYSFGTAVAVTDKRKMKRVLCDSGLPTSEFVEVTSPDEDVNLQCPLVVKPVDSNGNRGICRLDDPERLRSALADAISASKTGSAIVERYVGGVETSIYTYVLHGRAHVITSNERLVHNDADTGKMPGYAMIYPCAAVDDNRERIQKLCDGVARAFGLENTPLTIQAKIDGDAVNIIEIMPRIGGGQSYWNIRRLTGFDIMSAAIDSFEGVEPALDHAAPKSFTMTNHIYSKGGMFGEVRGGDELMANGDVDEFKVLRSAGDVVKGDLSSGNRVCSFVVSGSSRSEVVEKARNAFSQVRVVGQDGCDMKRSDIHV